MTSPKASVLIPVYNRIPDLLELLEDLARQDCSSFEVVVVDDGSTTPVVSQVRPESYPFPLTLVRTAENQGIGHARNRAVEHARGEILIWIDSDSRVEGPGWLSGHIRFHAQSPREWGLPLDAPVVLHSKVSGNCMSYAGRSFMYSNWFTSCQAHPHGIKSHHVPTNNTSIPASLHKQVGPFDEDLRAAEDVDWSLRALGMGVPLCYVPDFPVLHKDRDTMAKLWESYVQMGHYARLVRIKHPGSPFGWLYPRNPLLERLQVMPLSFLMTVYVLATWLPVDRRVVWYLPGIFYANLASASSCMNTWKPAAHSSPQ